MIFDKTDLDVEQFKDYTQAQFVSEFSSPAMLEGGPWPHLKGQEREDFLKALYFKIVPRKPISVVEMIIPERPPEPEPAAEQPNKEPAKQEEPAPAEAPKKEEPKEKPEENTPEILPGQLKKEEEPKPKTKNKAPKKKA